MKKNELEVMFDLANHELDIQNTYNSNQTTLNLLRLVETKLSNYSDRVVNGKNEKIIQIRGVDQSLRELKNIMNDKIRKLNDVEKSIDLKYPVLVVTTVINILSSTFISNSSVSFGLKLGSAIILIMLIYLLGAFFYWLKSTSVSMNSNELRFYNLVLDIINQIES